jgi:HK97 family phage major capsid protein
MAAVPVDAQLKELRDLNKKTTEQVAVLTKNFTGVVEQLKKQPAFDPSWAFGGKSPHGRVGENPMTSRGFSFAKMIGVLSGAIEPSEAKVEIEEVHAKLHKQVSEGRDGGYGYAGRGMTGMNRFLAPLSTKFLPGGWVDGATRKELRDMVTAGVDGADWDEMQHYRRKSLLGMGYSQKALSWISELNGGSLVAPPEMGELIELLRNKEALINAGARTVPLPPQGRLKFPRQTTASTTYWIGENTGIPESEIGTGEVTLQAKKLAVLIKSPNELIRFASPAAEALIRDDMTKSLALGLDLAGLEGLGGDNRPRGVIQMPNINRISSSSPGADGDAFVGQDIYRMIAAVEESNAEFEGFLMRPKSLYKFYQLRASAVAQGDSEGPFLFNLIREAGDGVQASLAGYPVTKSTQISQSRVKGNSSNLTYILGGMFSEILIGMFGAIEFAATTLGDESFTRDQTWVRGIVSADINVRHEAAFCLLDQLNNRL